MTRSFPIFATCAAVLAFCQTASAGDITGPIVTLIVRNYDGLTYVQVEGTPTDRAACAQSTSYWMLPDENSDNGKRTYAMLLAARIRNSPYAFTARAVVLGGETAKASVSCSSGASDIAWAARDDRFGRTWARGEFVR